MKIRKVRKDELDLFVAVLDRYYDRLAGVLHEALAREGTAEERIGRLVDAYVDFLAANRGFSRIVQRESSGGAHVERIVSRMEPLFAQGVSVVRRAFPGERITFAPDRRRQVIVDSWPEDVDDARARRDWGFKPAYDLRRTFEEYLTPTITRRYAPR